MGKDSILLSSGFIVPKSNLFSVIRKEDNFRTRFLVNRTPSMTNATLGSLIDDGLLHSSAVCSEALIKYNTDPSVENYLSIVDLTAEVFADCGISEFISAQANNPYLSPLGWRLCVQLLDRSLLKDYNGYLVATNILRLEDGSRLSEEERRVRSKFASSETKYANFPLLIKDLSLAKGPLLAFFKYVLCDSNRGGTYA